MATKKRTVKKSHKKVLDSNRMDTTVQEVCLPCGIAANVLTCLKKYGQRPNQLCFSLSTFHKDRCDYCGELTSVTQTRDFFYPDFGLLEIFAAFLHQK